MKTESEEEADQESSEVDGRKKHVNRQKTKNRGNSLKKR